MRSSRSRRGGPRRTFATFAIFAGLLAGASASAAGAAATSAAATGAGPLDISAIYHDSRNGEYRTPGGAVPAGTAITLRVRTAHGGATGVRLVLSGDGPTRVTPMQVAASGVACGAPAPSAGTSATCDLWATTVSTAKSETLGYHFIVQDGSTDATLSDDPRGDGGPGIAGPSVSVTDWVVTVYTPGFSPVSWLDGAVVYQIFPDRFVNGNTANDANPSQPRYGYPPDTSDRIVREPWNALPPSPSSGGEYYGGDLAGIRSKLGYLHDLGVTVIYLNPIFASASNHGYDTRDYFTIDPRFGTQADYDALVHDAAALGIHVILDGVFDHVSSDSPYFDRYGRYPSTPGACQSVSSPYRSWFTFTPLVGGPCAGPDGPHTMDYAGWNSIGTLPVLDKKNPAVQQLIYGGPSSIALHWLGLGASGWRIDTMSDPSFPKGFWQAFRQSVKAAYPNAPIVGEAWQSFQVLPLIRGDTADTIMDYRSRTPILAYLGQADSRGFPDDGVSGLSPSVLASELAGVLESEPPAVAATAFKLLDSHDTERVLWSLTPGSTAADKALPANVAIGKARLRLASLIDFTMPGAPVVYYGDEVGLTGATDPDDRRTFPTDGGDTALAAWYRLLATTRDASPVLKDGDVRFLLTDDASRAFVYARTSPGSLAITAVNPGSATVTLDVPLAEPADGGTPIRDGIEFRDLLGGPDVTSAGGHLRLSLPATGGALLVPVAGQSLVAPAAPAHVRATRASSGVVVEWSPVAGATTYAIWRSPVAGGGYVRVGSSAGPSFSDSAAPTTEQHYVVRAADAAGNVSPASADAAVAAGTASAPPSDALPMWVVVLVGLLPMVGLIVVARIVGRRLRLS